MLSHTPETSTQCLKEESEQGDRTVAASAQTRLLTAKLIQSGFLVKRKNLSCNIATDVA